MPDGHFTHAKQSKPFRHHEVSTLLTCHQVLVQTWLYDRSDHFLNPF